MSYLSLDLSIQGGNPVFLYEFVQGARVWRYNSSSKEIIWGGQSWSANNLSHSEISQTGEMSKDGLTLSFPMTDSFAKEFLGYAADIVTSVTIRRGHINDGEFIVHWRGRVIAGKASKKTISIECESIFTSLRRPGLRARYQRNCRHALYSAQCGVIKASYAVAGTVSAISQNNVTIAEAAAYADGWFTGGYATYTDGSMRMIVSHVGSDIQLSKYISKVNQDFGTPGFGAVILTIYPGCDRLKTTCITKFNNVDNFGGFPWIPLKNPFGGSSIV